MTTFPAPTMHPLTGPTVSGTTYTVDFLLRNPTRVTATVADLTMRNFFLDSIFRTGGQVQGGAVLYEVYDQNMTYAERDVETIEPGAEAPLITFVRGTLLTKQVEKFGGKFATTREARDRNDLGAFDNSLRQLGNTISRKMNQRGMAELAAAVTAYSRTASGTSWSDAMGLTFDTTAANLLPGRDFAAVNKAVENLEMGYTYDTLIVNPDQAESLDVIYGDRLDSVLSRYGITTLISTPRKATGSAYFLASGQVGEMRVEQPLRTTFADETLSAPTMIEQTWTQSLVNPVMYVTDPFAILELTGLAA